MRTPIMQVFIEGRLYCILNFILRMYHLTSVLNNNGVLI
ncbi:hypothetical protein PPAR_b0127 [Pseudoalteromonas paragorgicola KMM 3548]|nr:hypothetical protein [Pseudoalteromonas distincta KMM 3548]